MRASSFKAALGRERKNQFNSLTAGFVLNSLLQNDRLCKIMETEIELGSVTASSHTPHDLGFTDSGCITTTAGD